VNVQVQNKNHLTPLHLASFYGWVKLVRMLLNRGETANREDNLGRTPLHMVAKGSRDLGHDASVRVAKLLLEHGADIDAQSKDSATPLHVASYYGRVEMVRVLPRPWCNQLEG
jgi:ankyrin repeat protein